MTAVRLLYQMDELLRLDEIRPKIILRPPDAFSEILSDNMWSKLADNLDTFQGKRSFAGNHHIA